MTWETF